MKNSQARGGTHSGVLPAEFVVSMSTVSSCSMASCVMSMDIVAADLSVLGQREEQHLGLSRNTQRL